MIFVIPAQQAHATPPATSPPATFPLNSMIGAATAAQMPTMKQVMPATAWRNPLMPSSVGHVSEAVNGS